MTSLGVPCGAKKPYHDSDVSPGYPASATVGMFGAIFSRSFAAVTYAFRLPVFTWLTIAYDEFHMSCMMPAIRSWVAGASPRYGIKWSFVPVSFWKRAANACNPAVALP